MAAIASTPLVPYRIRSISRPRSTTSYGGRSAAEWVVGRLSPGGREETRLYMLDHALISYALRMRGADRADSSGAGGRTGG